MKSIDYANDDDEEGRDYKSKGGGKRGKKGKSKKSQKKTTPKARKGSPRKGRLKWAVFPGIWRKSVIPESQRSKLIQFVPFCCFIDTFDLMI